jgi:hypothetical protein
MGKAEPYIESRKLVEGKYVLLFTQYSHYRDVKGQKASMLFKEFPYPKGIGGIGKWATFTRLTRHMF